MSRLKEQAALLKAVAHPVRLEILDLLTHGETCVQDAQELLDVSQPNLSQHLAILKKAGLADCRIEGPKRCYFLCRPTLVMNLMSLLSMENE